MTSHSEKLSKDKDQACNITVKTSAFPLIISSYLEEMSNLHNDTVERLLFKAAAWSPRDYVLSPFSTRWRTASWTLLMPKLLTPVSKHMASAFNKTFRNKTEKSRCNLMLRIKPSYQNWHRRGQQLQSFTWLLGEPPVSQTAHQFLQLHWMDR